MKKYKKAMTKKKKGAKKKKDKALNKITETRDKG